MDSLFKKKEREREKKSTQEKQTNRSVLGTVSSREAAYNSRTTLVFIDPCSMGPSLSWPVREHLLRTQGLDVLVMVFIGYNKHVCHSIDFTL